MLTLWLSAVASAQAPADFVTMSGPLLAPSDLTWGTQTTVGSPAVFEQEVTYLFWDFPLTVVFYETQVGPPTAGCPAGTWGIGAAYTIGDGALTDYGPIVQPGTGYYSCVAAHPTVVSAGNGTVVVFFKAEQDPTACDPLTSPWGCDRYTGLGRLAVQYVGYNGPGANAVFFNVTPPDPTPVLTDVAQDMGYPSVAYANGDYHMAFAQNPDIYLTSSPFTNFGFSVPPSPVLIAGTSAWNESELHSPSIWCESPTDVRIAAGGRVFDPFPTLVDQSVGMYATTDLTTWTELGWPYLHLGGGDPEVRHLDYTTSHSGTEHAIWFTAPDPGGNTLYRLQTAGFDAQLVDEKRCP